MQQSLIMGYVMKQEEFPLLFDEVKSSIEHREVIENIIDVLMQDSVSAQNLTKHLIKMPFIIRDSLYSGKFRLFITGIWDGREYIR